MTDTRHPYTHACDYIRTFMGGSRSDASGLLTDMAEALGMDKEQLCTTLSLRFQEDGPSLKQAQAERLRQVLVETRMG